MHNGRFEQVGAKLDLYNNPQTRFVASFLGSPNHVRGQLKHAENHTAVMDWKGLELKIPTPSKARPGDKIDYFLKHEKIRIQPPQAGDHVQDENCIKGTLRDIIFKGQHSDYFVVMENGEELVGSAAAEAESLAIRQAVEVTWLPQAGDAFLAEDNNK
jgi:spermidine/putrescine transport system ATP-binding protein